MKSTACGPSYDYPGDENLVNLKDSTRDERAHLASFVCLFVCFLAKKIQVLVSYRFLTYSYTDPGTSIFFAKKKNTHKRHAHN